MEAISEPDLVVARVGHYAITKQLLHHWMVAAVRSEPTSGDIVPEPPSFTTCVAKLKADSRPAKATAALKGQCEQRYRSLVQQTLTELIRRQWVFGGAAEVHASVSNGDVQDHFEKFRREQFPTDAQYRGFLQSSGRTTSDLKLELKGDLVSEAIRSAIKTRAERISQTQIANYYDRHKRHFAVPERRELEIIRTGSKQQALRAKQEIAGGRSFAALSKAYTHLQPVFSKDGLVSHLGPGEYTEKPLNNAIFTAKTGVLEGPVRITLGYYVFRVKRIMSGYQRPFSRVEHSIEQTLPRQRAQRALAAFVKHWRLKWKAITHCRPGYIVAKCAKYKLTTTPEPADVLN